MLTNLIESGKTQMQISSATGVPQPVISRLISGDQKTCGYEYGKSIERFHRKNAKKRAA